MHDLLTVYADAAARLASRTDTDAWEDESDAALYRSVFKAGDLPSPPADLSTSRIYAMRGTHTYPSLAVDSVHFFATPDAYRCLGLWIVACLLEPGPDEFWLRITHAGSDVRHACVDTRYRSLEGEREGLHTRPHAVIYYPDIVTAHPAADKAPPLPDLLLTDRADRMAGFGDPDERDTVTGFGSDVGAWRFAEVLLNVSQPWNERVEVNFEGPFGFGGAAPGGAEVRLWLPGSVGWEAYQWPPVS
jgi:hypothetical protein